MVHVNKELLDAASGDVTLLEIAYVLDEYDFGRTTSPYPGEYLSEAGMLKKIATSENRAISEDDIINVLMTEFNWKIRPIFKIRFRKATNRINKILEAANNRASD